MLFLKIYSRKNVLIMFLFSMKHSYVLITPGVDSFLWFLHGIKELL